METILIGCAMLLVAAPARAASNSKEECFAAHEKAQESMLDGRLLEARDALRLCSSSECPNPVQSECAGWLVEVQQGIPTLVIVAESELGNPADIRVFLDDTLLEGSALDVPRELNPGVHRVRFELAGQPTREEVVVLRQNEKRRVLRVQFQKAPPPPVSADRPGEAGPSSTPVAPAGPRPIPPATYIFGAVALAAAGTSVFLGLNARAAYNDKEDSCAPNCAASDVDQVKNKLLVADVVGGAALLSAGAAVYFYLVRPVAAREQVAGSNPLHVSATPNGLSCELSGTF